MNMNRAVQLGAGAHPEGHDNPCIMEYVSQLQGEEWSDRPSCVHPTIAAAARSVNDWISPDARGRLLMLVPEMVGTGKIDIPEATVGQAISYAYMDTDPQATIEDRLLDYLKEVIRIVKAYA